MAFTVTTFRHPEVQSLDPTIVVLEDGQGARAEIWPALGFNCIRWKVARAGKDAELLYADSQLFSNGRPTRSGIPVLFPFPNRIAVGKYRWEGKDYQLPCNDAPQKNAIHGFACRKPWRVVGQGADGASSWVTGEFQISKDAPEAKGFWPADAILRLTYRLQAGRLRLEAEVTNPDKVSLPFGLGYHQYFRVPLVPGGKPEECLIQVPAKEFWELNDCLPPGTRKPVDPPRDLLRPRKFPDLQVDDVLTGIDRTQRPEPASGLSWNGTLRQADAGLELSMHSSPSFRELVIFTPGHHEAFCLEPYTCVTDAVNLQARGIDAGWLQLTPGAKWTGVVEMRVG